MECKEAWRYLPQLSKSKLRMQHLITAHTISNIAPSQLSYVNTLCMRWLRSAILLRLSRFMACSTSIAPHCHQVSDSYVRAQVYASYVYIYLLHALVQVQNSAVLLGSVHAGQQSQSAGLLSTIASWLASSPRQPWLTCNCYGLI